MDAKAVAIKIFNMKKKEFDAAMVKARPGIAKKIVIWFCDALDDLLSEDPSFDTDLWYNVVNDPLDRVKISKNEIRAIDGDVEIPAVEDKFRDIALDYVDSKQDTWAWGVVAKLQKAARSVNLNESVLVDDVMKEEIDPEEVGI
jgi:hypothetical protein